MLCTWLDLIKWLNSNLNILDGALSGRILCLLWSLYRYDKTHRLEVIAITNHAMMNYFVIYVHTPTVSIKYPFHHRCRERIMMIFSHKILCLWSVMIVKHVTHLERTNRRYKSYPGCVCVLWWAASIDLYCQFHLRLKPPQGCTQYQFVWSNQLLLLISLTGVRKMGRADQCGHFSEWIGLVQLHNPPPSCLVWPSLKKLVPSQPKITARPTMEGYSASADFGGFWVNQGKF